MADAIEIYFDFASPYAYFALPRLEALAEETGRSLRRKPVILWAVLKALSLPAPLEAEAKRGYLLHDMARSARFYGLPYRQPKRFPLPSHLAARAWYGLQDDPARADAFCRAVFTAYFVEGLDIAEAEVLQGIGARQGLSDGRLRTAMTAEASKAALEVTVAEAVGRGVWGSPFVFLDGEAFFGADRLPQIAWTLGRLAEVAAPPNSERQGPP